MSKPPKVHPTKPNTGFQVTKPIDVPNTLPCKKLLLQHDFGSTSSQTGNHSSVTINYAPPSNFSKIVLEWNGACNWTQIDTVFGVWLGGVEILRSSPAQGVNTSVAWTASKDVTRYSSLLLKKEAQELVVSFRHPVSQDARVYRITMFILFYPTDNRKSSRIAAARSESKADLILPISGDLKSKDGFWFQIENSTDVKLASFEIPRNAYRAVLEVYVSAHNVDEAWYWNYPTEYYNIDHLDDEPGDGPFRDVVINLDDDRVGAIWPFPVIYDALDNIFNPVASTRSFDLPSYDFELTPFLGNLLDGGVHNFSFSIGNAINVWYVGANLHLWLDRKSQRTKGKLVSSFDQRLNFTSMLRMQVPLGESWIEAHRMTSSQGWVQSSYGNITTRVNQNLSYTNYMDQKLGAATVQQLILSNDSVSFATSDDDNRYSFESAKNFSLAMKRQVRILEGKGNAINTLDLTTGYVDKKTYKKSKSRSDFKTSTLEDQQRGSSVWAIDNYTWNAASQGLKQSYKYRSVDGNGKVCYFRKIGSANATIVHDNEGVKC
ncbi:unnamed protein product [Linum tenue]|uniref:Peptide N-acetyl-beta-D-glucosaminyl asparaginase amidase A N-terminal domain-containing protein n=1 Tax=Linum tenue TaxID=586396 RepID=A0AAV0KPM6_9ROSI|nr:unnamed protein product [Linum tenue]